MASNQNKFVDRTPLILTAGKVSDSLGNSVATCLQNYTIDDATDALKLIAPSNPTKCLFKHEPYTNRMRKGVYTDIQPILQPPVKTRHETIINELKETSYDSHWNKVVGRSRDPIPGLPQGFIPLNHTFGHRYDKKENMKELINPSKTPYQVLEESRIAHDLYKKSHNDYDIGEKICRNYTPSFDSSKRFGMHSKYDPRGIWVKCACTWHKNEDVVFTNKVHSDFLNKTRNKLGQSLNQKPSHLPEDFTYGKPNDNNLYGVEELLRDPNCPPCQCKQNLKCWLKAFNKMKTNFKRVLAKRAISFDDIFKQFLFYDIHKIYSLPLQTFYNISNSYKLPIDTKNIEPLLHLLSIISQNQINYKKFLSIVESKEETLELLKIQDIPRENQYYLTSSQAATCDYLIIDNSNIPIAGIPSIRYDLNRPIPPAGGCRADLENLGDEASAGILLNPSIYCNYGLSFRDFFMPRDEKFLRTLFGKVGYQIDEKMFKKIWEEGMDKDKTGQVCVDTFKKLLEKYCDQIRQVIVDEATC